MNIETAKFALALLMSPIFFIGGLCYLVANRFAAGWGAFQDVMERED